MGTPKYLTNVIAILLGIMTTAQAKLLFSDDFNAATVNESVWRLPVGPGTYYGRTQIKPPVYAGKNLRPVVSGGILTLQLDTYNASALVPGDSLWGQEVQTRQSFPVGSGLSVKARMRYVGTPQGGLVGGFFLYRLNGAVRDEIDFELLSNDFGNQTVFTNIYDDGSFGQAGDFANLDVPGLRLDAWHEYEIRWFQNETHWLVDGTRVRQVNASITDSDMEVRLNLWGPDAAFPRGYNPALQPAGSAAANASYQLQVDYVSVARLAPDLVIATPRVDDSERLAGQPFGLTTQVTNDGDAFSPATTLRFFGSQEPDVTPTDELLGSSEVSELSSSGTDSIMTAVQAPAAAGSFWIMACVDKVADEQTTDNNCSAAIRIDVLIADAAALSPIIDRIIQDDD